MNRFNTSIWSSTPPVGPTPFGHPPIDLSESSGVSDHHLVECFRFPKMKEMKCLCIIQIIHV